ncbi:MAG TPA: RNA 3'-terminal phosphate cyclase [Terriglobales bacterium]|nr:RNA 3'-terminal phosphate cyclase [Terriglobales bacterium]
MSGSAIEIDGGFSVAFAAVTGRPLHLHNARAGRGQPGLRPQHLAAVHIPAPGSGAVKQWSSGGESPCQSVPVRAAGTDLHGRSSMVET